MKKTMKRIFVLVMCLTLTLAFNLMGVQTLAAQSGNTSYNSGQIASPYGNCNLTLTVSNAASVSDDTITIVADRAYHQSLSDLGDVYNVAFQMLGVYASTDISSTGCDISEHYHHDNFQISTSTSKNGSVISVSAGGRLIGDLPEVGEVKNITLTTYISVISVWSGSYVVGDASKTVNIRVLCVDTSELSPLVMSVSRYQSSCWTPETWAPFAKAYNAANTIANDANSTQGQIDGAAYDLIIAKANLVHNGPITECEYCLHGCEGETNGIISLKNVQYGPDVRNVMDIYIPANKSGEIGMLMNVHGGAWIYGDKEYTTGSAYWDCVNYGVVSTAISYRYLSDEVNGSMMMDDIQNAVAKTKEVAAQYGLDCTKMIIGGGSAGGHLSLLYAYSRGSVSAVKPVAVISYSGPTDLTNSKYWSSSVSKSDMRNLLSWMCDRTITGSISQNYYKNELLKVSPVNYASTAVPTLMCHGMQDTTVDYSEATRLASALTTYGKTYELITFPNSGHGLESDPDQSSYASQRYAEYINTYLKDTSPSEVHRYASEIVPKTCTSDGYTLYSCKDCGQYFVSNIEKGGHMPGDWEVVTPASYEADGLEAIKCNVCGEILQSRAIPQLEPEEVIVFEPKEDAEIVIDEENMLITNLDQGIDSIDEYFNYEGVTVEYEETSHGFGTGTKVIIKSEMKGNVIAEYTLVISGDADGDGYVDAFDIAVAGEYINNFSEPDKIAFLKAMDIFEDGYLDVNDLAFINFISNYEG